MQIDNVVAIVGFSRKHKELHALGVGRTDALIIVLWSDFSSYISKAFLIQFFTFLLSIIPKAFVF